MSCHHHTIVVSLLMVINVLGVTAAAADVPSPDSVFMDSATVFLGFRQLERGPWSEVQTPIQLGVSAGWRAWAGPGELVVGIAQAKGAGISREPANGTAPLPVLGATARQPTKGQVEFTSWEFQVGLRHRWRRSLWEMSLAGGPELIQVGIVRTPGVTVLQSVSTLTTPVFTQSEQVWAPGAWVAAGATVHLGRSSLGVEGRYSFAHAQVLDEPASLGGWQLGAVFGMSW